MDFAALFANLTVAGVPLLAFVLGLVQWIKGFGLSGNPVRVASMAVGLVMGVGYQFQTAPPADLSAWLSAIVFGLALGLAASGIYDAANSGG